MKEGGDFGFAEDQNCNLNSVFSESSGVSVDFNQLRNLHYTSHEDYISKQKTVTDIVDVGLR